MNAFRWGILPVSGHFDLRVRGPLCALPDAAIRAVASRDQAKASRAAAWIGSHQGGKGTPKAWGDYQGLVSDPDIDAVYISLPNNLHLEWTMKALAAGKHVLCEKPFGMDAGEAGTAMAEAEKRGLLLMEAFMYRFHPQWRRARAILDSGEIGAVTAVECLFSFNNRDPQDIRNKVENGGGALYDIGCYAISSARWILGAEPKRVLGLIERDPDFGVDRLTSGVLDFGGPRALFTVSTQSAGFQTVTALGTKGSMIVHLPFNAYPDVPVSLEVRTGLGTRTVSCGPADQYGIMFREFAEAARGGLPAPTPMSDAVANMRTIDALFASGKTGTWVQVK